MGNNNSAEARADEAERRATEAGKRAADAVANAEHLRKWEKAREDATRRADEEKRRADDNMAARIQAEQRAQEAHQASDDAGRKAEQERVRADENQSARKDAERREKEAQRAKEEAEMAATLSARAAAQAAQAQRAAEDAAAEAEAAKREADEARKAAEERLLLGIPPDVRPTTEQMHEFRARHGYGSHALNIAITGESGANTPTISGWMYFMDQSLYIFDVLVVVFSDRFSQTAGTLLHNAQRCGIPAFLVRTKADNLVRSIKRDRRNQRLDDARARAILRAETQDMVNENLMKLGLPIQRVYLVSEDGLREWVVDRDSSSTIDEPAIFEMLVPTQPGKDPNQ